MFKVEKPKIKQQKISQDDIYLWHLTLGHINLDGIDKWMKSGALNQLKLDTLPICESCLKGKITRDLLVEKG